MSALVDIIEQESGEYKVQYHNGADLGTLEIASDGYFSYWPKMYGGYWSSHVMRAIADHLDRLNEQWHEQVQKGLNEAEGES